MSVSAVAASKPSQVSYRSITAAIIGNALEWFDLIVYGFFAATIARLFFPEANPSVSLLLALGTFGSAFVVRPIGAVLIGRFADRSGRRAALVMVSSLMLLGTFIIAVLPTYAQIGVFAPALLLTARLIQGFSAGGEFGSATAYLAEQSPDRRAFYSSWQFASQGLATLLASGFGLAVTSLLPPAQMDSWGWRLPFIFGLLIGPVAYFIRNHAEETPEFEAMRAAPARQTAKIPMRELVGKIALGTGMVMVATVSMYLMVYMPTYAKTVLGLDASTGFSATLTAGFALMIMPPLMGLVADRFGRVVVAVPSVFLLVLVPVPLFSWLVAGMMPDRVIWLQLILGLVTASYLGALPALLADMFTVEQRTIGLSLCYNIAVVTAGGFAPLAFAVMIEMSGNRVAPSFYLVLSAIVSLVCVLMARLKGWAR